MSSPERGAVESDVRDIRTTCGELRALEVPETAIEPIEGYAAQLLRDKAEQVGGEGAGNVPDLLAAVDKAHERLDTDTIYELVERHLYGQPTQPIPAGDLSTPEKSNPTATNPQPQDGLAELAEDCDEAAAAQDRLRVDLEESGGGDIELAEARECAGKASAFRQVASRIRSRQEAELDAGFLGALLQSSDQKGR